MHVIKQTGTTMETIGAPAPMCPSTPFTLDSKWSDEVFRDAPAKPKPTHTKAGFLFRPQR